MADTVTGTIGEFFDEGKKQVGQLVKPTITSQASGPLQPAVAPGVLAHKEQARQQQIATQRQTIQQEIQKAQQGRAQHEQTYHANLGSSNVKGQSGSSKSSVSQMPQDLQAILRQKRIELKGNKSGE